MLCLELTLKILFCAKEYQRNEHFINDIIRRRNKNWKNSSAFFCPKLDGSNLQYLGLSACLSVLNRFSEMISGQNTLF